MTRLLRHRGPDGAGYYESPNGLFNLGFRRLSIIDLRTGDQPLFDRRHRMVLAGNGEIYNYVELRRKYIDYPFYTFGDMETVLAAFANEGDSYLKSLNGMFALALYDEAEHRLRLVRDRLGIKPLYYAHLSDGTVIFASEIKPLFASGLIAPEVDTAQVSAYLAHGYVPAPHTLFKQIKKVPPGHVITIDAEGVLTFERYWEASVNKDLPSEVDSLCEYLTDLLDDSIRMQMRSDVPVGALLSGGLDSGLLVALAAHHTQSPLCTFTVQFEGTHVDEGPLSRLVANKYSTTHEEVHLGLNDAASLLPKLAWHMEEPVNDAALVPNYLVEQALGQQITVALNGTGGDELFAGYGRYFLKSIETTLLRMPATLRQHLLIPLVSTLDPFRSWQIERAEKFERDPGGYIHDHSTHFPSAILQSIGNFMLPPAPAQRHFADEREGARQTRMLYGDLNTYLPDDLLTLLDRTTMAVSVEGRVPFLDHRFVEAALSVNPEVRTPAGVQKGLERQIAARFLPAAVIAAPKQGFAAPVPAWMAGDLGQQARRLLTRRTAMERGWWTEHGIRRLCNDPARHGFRVYTLLMLELSVIMLTERPISESIPNDTLADLADAA